VAAMMRGTRTDPSFNPQDYLTGKKRWMRPALVPFDLGALKFYEPIIMEDNTSEEEQKAFYEALVSISWLPTKVRAAVLEEIGSSLSDYKAMRTRVLRMFFVSLMEHMRTSGIRGGALAMIAKQQRMSVLALKQRLRRSKKKLHR
jgi:hypothetical protein